MTLAVPQLVSLLGGPLLVGCALLRLLGLRFAHDRLAYFGWAYVAGALASGVLLFAWACLEWPLDARFQAPALVVLALLLWMPTWRRRVEAEPAPVEEPTASTAESWLFYLVLFLTLLVTFERIGRANLLPVITGDEATIWAEKAKAIFLAGGFNADFEAFCSGPNRLHHPDYPLLNSLLQVWSFAHAGEILHVENRLPILAFVVALILVVAGALRQRVRPGIAALLLTLLAGMRMLAAQTYRANSDVMVALGFVLALDAFLRWREQGSAVWLRLGALALAFLLWSKHDSALYVLALLSAAVLSRLLAQRPAKPLGRGLVWFLLPLGVLALSWAFNAAFGFENDLMVGGTERTSPLLLLASQLDERLGTIAAYFWSETVADPAESSLLFVLFFVLLLFFPKRTLSGRLGFPTFVFLAVFCGYLLVYCASHHELDWHLRTSALRVTFQSLPALLVWTALAAAVLFPGLARGGEPPSAPVRLHD